MLTKAETKKLISLLKKIDNPHAGFQKELFLPLIKLMPIPACELAIVNKKKQILLTWRDDAFWRGWHIPGGLMRFRETFEERIQAVAQFELGIHIDKYRFLTASNHVDDARAHAVSLLFLCHTADKPKTGKWFSVPPKNCIQHHAELFLMAKKHLK